MNRFKQWLYIFLISTIFCLSLCACGGPNVPYLPEYDEPPSEGEYPYYLIWNTDLYGFRRTAKPASEWGISKDALTQRGVTEYPQLSWSEKQNGLRMFAYMDENEDEGCPVWQDKEGRLYLEVRPGMYWRLCWVIYGSGTDEERQELEYLHQLLFPIP